MSHTICFTERSCPLSQDGALIQILAECNHFLGKGEEVGAGGGDGGGGGGGGGGQENKGLTVLARRVMKLASNLAKYSRHTTDRACQYAGCRAPANALTFCPRLREAMPSALALSAASALIVDSHDGDDNHVLTGYQQG